MAIFDGAEWLNPQAQNALLRLLEEPPPGTSLILAASRASAIIATIRSRSMRIRFPSDEARVLRGLDADGDVADIVSLLDGLRGRSIGDVLDFAENYRGARAVAAESVTELIDVSAEWLRQDVKARVERGEPPACGASTPTGASSSCDGT